MRSMTPQTSPAPPAPSPSGRTDAKPALFYGWKLSLLCALGNLMLQGSAMYGMNAFLEPLSANYGWSRTSLGVSMGVAALGGFASVPLLGTIAMRFSLRNVMAVGALVGGASFVLMGQTQNIVLFTVFFCLTWITGQCCGGMVANALVCNWFVRRRGRAFGLANIGTSFSGATIPFLALVCISLWGTSAAYAVLGCAAMLLAPLCYALVRDTPAQLGLHPDGERQDPPQHRGGGDDCSIRAMLHRPEAYYIGLAFGLGLMCASGVMSQLKPRFTELGLSSYHAMILSCASALFSGLSKYGWGWFCDRTNPLLVARVTLLSNAVMLAVSLLPHNAVTLVISSIILGACCGGYWTVLPAIVSYYFGANSFLAAYRFVSFFIILKSLAYPILGLSYDMTGSYNSGYMVYIGLISLGFILTLLVDGKKAHDWAGAAR